MIKKFLCTLIAFTAAAALLTGCSSKSAASNTTVTESGPLSGNGYTSENLNLAQCAENVENYFRNGDYDINDISVEIPTDENNFFNVIIVKENQPADASAYVDICNECIAKLNEEAVKQDPQYSPASEGYYGGLFDQYTVVLTATCIDDILKKWPVYQTINSGAHDPIVTNDDEIDLGALS